MPRVSTFPRCWDRQTQEEVTRWAWYVNQERKPHPRAVLVKGEDIAVVEVSLTPWWDEKPDEPPCLDCGSTKPDSRAPGTLPVLLPAPPCRGDSLRLQTL